MKQIIGGIALLLLTATEPPPKLKPRIAAPDEAGWPKYCGTPSMSGTPTGPSALEVATVPRLKLAWTTSLQGPIASAPSVQGRNLYVGDWGGFETRIDVRNGEVLAQADLGRTETPQCDPSVLGVTSSPAIDGKLVYVAGGDNAFYALDRDTLKVIWRKSLGDNSADGGYYGWSSPSVVEGRVLQGVASNCDTPFVPGRLVALDAQTGEEVAFAAFIGEGGVGNGVWTSPTVDLENRKIFVTTASGLDYFDGLGYSIVRLDLQTLALEDSWKVTAEDSTWDADWGSSPTLFTDESGRALVGAGHKDGHYYAFLQSDLSGGPVWAANVAVSGDVPQDGEGTLSTAAFDGKTLYVGGGIPPGSTDPLVGGSVVAINPASGEILWRQGFPGTVIAPVSTVRGVVFAAGGNLVAALDAADGKVLWSYRTASYLYGGVAIAGDTIFVGDLSGQLYAFRIF
jgi:outer membrane protein assembly factor BamB